MIFLKLGSFYSATYNLYLYINILFLCNSYFFFNCIVVRRVLFEIILQPKVQFKVTRKLETKNQNPYPIAFMTINDHPSCQRKEIMKGHMNESFLSSCLLCFRLFFSQYGITGSSFIYLHLYFLFLGEGIYIIILIQCQASFCVNCTIIIYTQDF